MISCSCAGSMFKVIKRSISAKNEKGHNFDPEYNNKDPRLDMMSNYNNYSKTFLQKYFTDCRLEQLRTFLLHFLKL